MEHISDLATKLDLALKALTLSRVGLAQALGVDKSLVGRWLGGTVHPTEHNLSRLTALISRRHEGFRLIDWYGGLDEFARGFGVEPATPSNLPPAILRQGPLARFIESSHHELMLHGAAYEGFWRTARPSLLMRDRVFHDYGFIRRGADGLLEVHIKGSGLAFNGWLFPIAGNVFVFLFDETGRTPMTVLMRGVTLPKAMVMDGLLQLAALDSDRTPAAVPIVLERMGDLIGDDAQDRATCDRMILEEAGPIDPIPTDQLEARLFRSVGRDVLAAGGEAFLAVTSARSLSRGVTAAGLVG
ncbi:MAG: hypothetical protein Q8R44_18340 [Novosphingobium sp.]|nr:hypothetical protein [Novosphingobium sp.]